LAVADHVCGVARAQPYNQISVKDVKLHCACTHVSGFTVPSYISEMGSLHHRKEM